MCLLDISQSYYIIEQQKVTGFVTIFIFVSFILIFSYFLKAEYVSPNRKQSELIGYASMLIILFTSYIFHFYPQFKEPYQLEKNYSETVGTTIQFIGGGDDTPYVEYTFTLHEKKYIKKGNIVYGGSRIPDLIYPHGHYVVIYDSLNPENSEMDFKRFVKE